jgi:hypothetical protein
MAKTQTSKKKTVKAPKDENKSTKESVSTVSKAEQIKPFSELFTIACRQEWGKRHLVEFVETTYEGCEVKVDALNARQICFHIDGIKVPEDGYFSVK